MCLWRIEYSPTYQPTPVSFWVHRALDHAIWLEATQFNPPLPRPIGGKGYPILIISCFDYEFQFASVEEAEHVLAILTQKNMPTSRQLSAQRGAEYGPNRHWLSRLPAKVKPWSKRQKLLPCFAEGIQALKQGLSRKR